MRYLFRFEAEHLLERCGLHVEALHRDYSGNPIEDGVKGDLVFTCRAK
jgi:hypothetical protein